MNDTIQWRDTRQVESRGLQKIDLHVHSKYAGRFNPAVLKQLEVDESHTEPVALYERLMVRGMSMVTITDHDAIQGCLEIAHLPHTFISEEVSARFPENGCIVHVLTWGITEAQHHEMQRLRRDIYELVPYIREQGILHALAHPFSSVNLRLNPDLLRKSLLMFDVVELTNGQKDPQQEWFVREVLAKVDDAMLERWAEQYQLPVPPRRVWGLTGGSDDHSGVTMARAYTSFHGERTFEGLRKAILGRSTKVHAMEMTATNWAHTAAIGTINHFRHHYGQNRAGGGVKQTYQQVIEMVASRKLPASINTLPPALQRLVPAAFEAMGEAEELPTLAKLVTEGHTPEFHDEVYDLAQSALLRAFRACTRQVGDRLVKFDWESVIDEIPTMLRLSLFNFPYYFGFRFFHGERRRGWALYESLKLPNALERSKRAAVFCDTLDNVDGVGIGLRRIVHEMREDGREVFLCGAHGDDTITTTAEGAEIVRFPTLGHFPLPGYADYSIGWPSFVQVIRWLSEKDIDLVVASTPGPMGLIAMLAARLLEIPVAGQYHTNLGDFARRILGDATLGRIVEAYTGWFYGTMSRVAVPTQATREQLIDRHALRPERMQVVRRGVDTQRFHPGHQDPAFWRSYGLTGHNTLLYVGRVSHEKNLLFLSQVFRELVDHGADVELALVGDGPLRQQLEHELADYPVVFTGYLRGEQLATAFASADLLVFPSITDTFGNVVMESLASGTPALVSNRGGPPELVHHREAGLVLPVDNPATWVDAIETLVLEPGRLASMSRCARKLAETSTFARARSDQWSFYATAIDTFRAGRREAVF